MRALPLLVLAAVLGAPVAMAQSAPLPPLPLPPAPPPTAATGSAGAPASASAPAPAPASAPAPAPAPAPAAAPASEPLPSPGEHLHDGLYLRLSLGWSYGWISGSGPHGAAGVSGDGAALLLALGGTPVRGLVVAGTLMVQDAGGTFEGAPPGASGRASAGAVILGGLVDWYPRPEDGWHLGGSLGLGAVGLTDAARNSSSGGGLGVSILGGYDWWIGPQWSLGLMGLVATSTTVHMSDSNRNDTGYQFTPATIGIEASILYH